MQMKKFKRFHIFLFLHKQYLNISMKWKVYFHNNARFHCPLKRRTKTGDVLCLISL